MPLPGVHYRPIILTAIGLCLLVATATAPGRDLATANADWMRAYEILESAAKAEKDENPALALELYNQARQRFSDVQTQHPSWNPALVNYRITFSLKQIQRLQSQVQNRNGSLTHSELLALNSAQTEKINNLQGANEQLQHRLEITAKALERAREEAARSLLSSTEASQLVQEKKALEQQLGALQREIADLTRQRDADNDSPKKRLAQDACRQERDLALVRLAEARARAHDYQQACERLKLQLHQKSQDFDKLAQAKEAELSTALTDLDRRNVSARQRLDQHYQGQIRQLESRLAELAQQQQRLQERIHNQVELIRQQEKLIADQGRVDQDLLLRERDAQIARLRNELVVEKAKNCQNDAERYLTQIHDLKSQLARERARTCALENALQQDVANRAAATPATQTTPAATAAFADAERQRRLNEKPLLANSYLRKGLAAEEKGNIEAAIWNYRKVLENQDQNTVALQRLGLIAAEQGNEQEAESYLNRAFILNPDDPTTLNALGFCLTRQRKAYPAIAMLTRAVALTPDSPAAHRALGVACSSLGWNDAAEVQFRQAFDLDRKDSETAFNLAILLASRGGSRMDEAKVWYQRARSLCDTPDPGLDQFFGLNN